MDRLLQLELFVRIAESGTISRAAEKLNVSTASASRALSLLEKRLNVRLVERNTRRLWLTEAGQIYATKCAALLNEMSDTEARISDQSVQPSGMLTVTSSVSFAMKHIAPALPEFCSLYPRLTVQIITSNKYMDFIEAGIDVAIRTREYERDSSISVRRLANNQRLLAAAPDYLEKHGVPSSPEDLHQHHILGYSLAKDPYFLNLSKGRLKQRIEIQPLMESNEGQVICSAALEGLGILVQPQYIVGEYVREGRLIQVLPDWALPPLMINLAYQSRRHQPAKIRVFADFMAKRFRTLAAQRQFELG